jgi:hypothetical protein
MRNILFLIMVVVFLMATPVQGARNITLPFSENFESNNYGDLLWLSNGATHSYQSSGGWQGGAARFTPPTYGDNGTYSGLGSFNFAERSRVHVRFLAKFGPQYINTSRSGAGNQQNKFAIFNPGSGGTRGMLSLYQAGGSNFSFGPCNNSTCKYECGEGTSPDAGDWWPNGQDRFLLADRLNEWIAIEYVIDLGAGITSVYIWTLDGALDGLYKQYYINQGGNINSLQILGGYYNGYHVSDPNSYVMFDELVIDGSFIGPPSGFGSGGGGQLPASPSVPQGFSISSTPPTSPPPEENNGLPWSSGFETGNISEWNGWPGGTVQVSSGNSQAGTYAARIPLVAGSLNDNYLEFLFGDNRLINLETVDEVYLRFYVMFESGYQFPSSQGHKLALFNLTDADGRRRYQVFISCDSAGRFYVDHSYMDTWQFFGLGQNVGTPVAVRYGQWDKIKLHVRLNTPGSSNGTIRLWVNDVLKLDYANRDIRQNATYGMNKLILSSYTTNQSGSNGVQWMDSWALATSDTVN